MDPVSAYPEMDGKTFAAFQELVYAQAGIRLGDAKATLVRARIGKRMRALGLSDHRAYLALVREDDSGQEIIELLDAISTNVTSFMREPAHFTILADLVRGMVDRGRQRLRLWSAACSSGEEPYSMALTLAEHLPLERLDVGILATDISTKVLARCRAGIFSEESLRPLSAALRQRYFSATGESGAKGALYKAKDSLRRLITVRRLNLSTPPFPMRGPMEAVFCRNVMIYFDNAVRQRLLDDITRLLADDGLLFVGHAESLTGTHGGLRSRHPAVYAKG